ncbi:MAG: N-acetylneuraminate synthase family protein [Ignavibacteriae bacterium]|nr:N-acetylneuraminate synthase family protein [Ignavibacteriota bacterium]
MKNYFPKQIKIGNKIIGEDYPTYIIAEIGANFDGNIEKAKELIKAAKECGADCAKFQSFKAEKIVSAGGFSKMKLKGIHGSWGRPVHEVFRDAEFPREWHKEINDYCIELGIDFSTSPYDFEAVDLCIDLNVPFIKIGSGEITWLEMLTFIAKKNKPMFLATGDATMSEIDEAIRTIESTGNNQLVLMQCITNYPSLIESANINVLKTFQTAFNILTGYSDHSPGPVVALGSIALGAKVIEKHFTLSNYDIGPDHPHSMNVNEFKRMVDYIRELEEALGSTRKVVVEEEAETVYVQRRGLYSTKFIPKGKIIDRDDLTVLRPALGIYPKYKDSVIGRTASKNIEEDAPIYWTDL